MYSSDVRRAALARLDSGESVSEVSRATGLSRSTLTGWVAQNPDIATRADCPRCTTAHLDHKAYPAVLGYYLGDVSSHVVVVVAPGTRVVQAYWTHWPCLFPQRGSGRKPQRVLGMQEWQWELVERHPAAFLRGLFHSDGSRSNNWATRQVAGSQKRYDYPRWEFSNRSEEILEWCAAALDLAQIG